MSATAALLFDFNGTLSHDEPLLCTIYMQLCAEHGRPLTEREYFDQLAGLSEEAIIGGWLGVTGKRLERLIEERIERYVRAADGSSILPHTRAAVRHAAGRVPVAIVSSASRREIEPVVRRAGLDGIFAFVIGSEDASEHKPSPVPYLAALARLELPSAAVVALEDSAAGVLAATGAGVRCVAVSGTADPSRLAAAEEIVARIDVELVDRLLVPAP